MHMIDVMKKLQEIAEAGYDNEDIQRGIDAAGKHTVAEAQSPAQKAAFQKMLDAKKGDKPEAEDDDEEDAVSQLSEADWRDIANKLTWGAIDSRAEQDAQDAAPKPAAKKLRPAKRGEFGQGEFGGTPTGATTPAQTGGAQGEFGGTSRPNAPAKRKAPMLPPGQVVAEMDWRDIANNYDTSKIKEDDDIQEVHEDEIDEAVVEVPVNELAELMQLAGYTDYAEKIEEYANEPDPEYMDAEEQLIGLSGGLNGPKKMYAAAAGGDNPMDQEPREVTESTFESFYKKYDKFVAELTESEQDK